MTESTYWLIERPGEPGRPEYWGTKRKWTTDPWKARWFNTEDEANRLIRSGTHPFIPTVVEAKAVSHGFQVGGSAAERQERLIEGLVFEVVHDDGEALQVVSAEAYFQLREVVEELETKLGVCKHERDILMREVSEFTGNA